MNHPSYDSWFWSYRWYLKVHDFGPVGDEDNWSTLDNPMLELESLYSLLATVLPASKLNASKSSLFPILENSPDENPMNLIFIILTGPNAEETATSLYISLFYKTNKGKFITWIRGSNEFLSRCRGNRPWESFRIIQFVFSNFGSILRWKIFWNFNPSSCP